MFDDEHMDVSVDLQIVAADKLNDGLVIQFGDGRCAFFSASLLNALYEAAEKVDEEDIAWWFYEHRFASIRKSCR